MNFTRGWWRIKYPACNGLAISVGEERRDSQHAAEGLKKGFRSMYRLTIPLMVAVILATACAKGPETAPPPEIVPPDDAILGTVEFVEVEGGCWRIRADDGTSYEPLSGMHEEFAQDGLRVAVVLSFPDNLMGSLCQVGILANVEWIARVDTR